MAMSKYETIMWEEKMKEQILAHFRILHAEELTPVSVLDVISTKPQGVYKSYVIMIDTPRSTEYKILLSTEGKRSVGDGLERLLITLRQRLAPCLDKLAPDAGEEQLARVEVMIG